jgi:hypothetical protein
MGLFQLATITPSPGFVGEHPDDEHAASVRMKAVKMSRRKSRPFGTSRHRSQRPLEASIGV